MNFKFWALSLLIIIGVFTGCSSADKLNSDTAEGAYAIAQKYEKDERFEEAIAQYNEVANKHPYSKLALEAKLKIADIHFRRENYIEAQTAYQLFKEFHPRHSRIDYVTYQLGLSYFHQLPDTIDRDLSIANKAIIYFDEVLKSYSQSEFAPKAEEYKQKSLKMLGEKELYIADFYYIRDQYDSALGRFEDFLESFSQSQLIPRALYGAAMSSHYLKDNLKTKKYYQLLVSQYPNSDEAHKIQGKISDGDDLPR